MRIVHYINQFFGQVGGEDMAGHPFEVREGVVGPGMALRGQLKDIGEITATVVCGDNYAVENPDIFREQLVKTLQEQKADLLVAGPAFNAGRYGMACGQACQVAYEELGIEAVSGMYEENPGLELYRKYAYIVPTGNSARNMRDALAAMKGIIAKIAAGEDMGTPEEGGFFERGFRKNFYSEKTGAERMADMLITKMRGEEYKTEMPMPLFEKVTPSPAIPDTGKAKIIVMTSGGMVPLGNPDHLEACNCTKYKRYNFDESYGGKGVTKGLVVHGGYDPVYGNEDGNRILPVDALVELEKEGRIGELCDFTFVTVGNGMGTDQAAQFGEAIAEELKREQIQGAILTST